MAISLDKVEKQAPALVSLAKQASISVTSAGLNGQAAKVALCLDWSGSMRKLYQDQTVQRLAERVLALGTQFDDDGAIDVFFFDAGAWYAGELGLDDYVGGIDRFTQGRKMGTTNYAAAMELVRKHYAAPARKKGLFGKRTEIGPSDLPAYVLFLTDGSPDNKSAATRQLVEASREGIFWQFIGVGGDASSFPFLAKLDDQVPGRLIDNANFFAVESLDTLSDETLFARMLAEFPGWIPQARAEGLIA